MADSERSLPRRGSKASTGSFLRKKSLVLTSWVTPSFDNANLSVPPRGALKPENGASDNVAAKKRRADSPSVANNDGELLTERWRPSCRSELCVHPKKVAEVAEWLQRALSTETSHRGQLLLMTGPPGAGKSATVRCLATELRADLCEWNSPLGGQELPKLEEFLFRSDRYAAPGAGARRLLMLEDLPAAIIDEPILLRSLLERHRENGRSPLVLIISDSQHRTLSSSRLLPRASQEALGLPVIRFNPVAPTQLTKALQRVLRGELKSRRIRMGGQEVAQVVAECGGDIRCALNRLHFLLANTSYCKTEEDESREGSLSIFRALGKVLHCKRVASKDGAERISQEPPPLAFDPEAVISASRLPGPLFAAFLHENCPDFFANISELSEAAETFSLADRLAAVWQEGRAAGNQLADLYSGSLAARGIAWAKRQPRHVGFRPLRRPQLLDLAGTTFGAEDRRELLDMRPFRRILRAGGRACGLPPSLRRSGRALREHDSAFEDASRPQFRKESKDETEWMIAEENEDQVAIEDCD